MKVLMFGWEFPPIHSGGLGVACEGIVEGLTENGHRVWLVLPNMSAAGQTAQGENGWTVLPAGETHVQRIGAGFSSPYATAAAYKKTARQTAMYGGDLLAAVDQYAKDASRLAKTTPHDIIHTHDWLTAEAGVQAQRFSRKAHVMHVHATEMDRTGGNPNQAVYDRERRGMEQSDRVIAVSQFTKDMIMKHYGIPEWKIEVVHNAVKETAPHEAARHLETDDKIVLFLGRMTIQKGPDIFLRMAKRVLEKIRNAKFIMAGDGDMMTRVIHLAVELGIEKNVLFAGFITGNEVARAYRLADLYVMPSVSEPFGIAPLEAIRHGTPVLISRQSGVSEVIKNALRADFWDVDDMASKVIAALSYPALTQTLREHGQHEILRFSWKKQAEKIAAIYHKLVHA